MYDMQLPPNPKLKTGVSWEGRQEAHGIYTTNIMKEFKS